MRQRWLGVSHLARRAQAVTRLDRYLHSTCSTLAALLVTFWASPARCDQCQTSQQRPRQDRWLSQSHPTGASRVNVGVCSHSSWHEGLVLMSVFAVAFRHTTTAPTTGAMRRSSGAKSDILSKSAGLAMRFSSAGRSVLNAWVTCTGTHCT
jgi:hypothetical protein